MKRLRKEMGTFLFSTMLIVGICIVLRLVTDIVDYMLYPGREPSIIELPGAVFWSILLQFITCGVFYMGVPFVNALLHRKSNSKVAHIIVGIVYVFGGLCLSPVSYLLATFFTIEGTGLPYQWRMYFFCVPYVICYLVGVAQLVYDIVRKKSESQNAVNA